MVKNKYLEKKVFYYFILYEKEGWAVVILWEDSFRFNGQRRFLSETVPVYWICPAPALCKDHWEDYRDAQAQIINWGINFLADLSVDLATSWFIQEAGSVLPLKTYSQYIYARSTNSSMDIWFCAGDPLGGDKI